MNQIHQDSTDSALTQLIVDMQELAEVVEVLCIKLDMHEERQQVCQILDNLKEFLG